MSEIVKTEDDWFEHYKNAGEHVALVAIAGGKIEGAQWFGAQKFLVYESNRRHMEPILAASKSRNIALFAVGVSVVSLGLNVWLSVRSDTKTEVELAPQSQPVLVYLTNGSALGSVESPKSQEAEPQTPSSE